MTIEVVTSTRWRHQMETSSPGPLWGKFTGDRWIPLTKASDTDVFFDLRLKERLGKQSVIWNAIAPIMTSL